MEKQIVITVDLASRAAHLGHAMPSLDGRTRAPFGTVDLFGAALDDPRPPGPGIPLR